MSLYPQRLRLVFALACTLTVGAAVGCGNRPDRLYALPLDRPPTAEDWARAVPLSVEAQGGRTSKPGEADVDSDAVHTATASCHHGTGAPAVGIDARAFYTTERLYLRFEWVDPTENLGAFWHWEGGGWKAAAGSGSQDGLGILWGREGQEFACVRACHLNDWRMSDPRAFAEYVMTAPPGTPELDLWVWRAGRGRMEGSAEDAHLGPKGREGDTPEDFEAPNSVAARAGDGQGAYQPGDVPYQAPEPEPGVRAPATLLLATGAGRTEVEAWGRRGQGTWQVVISRSLQGRDPGDVSFTPGREYAFGLATLDGVVKDHNAVAVPIRLLLVEPTSLKDAKE